MSNDKEDQEYFSDNNDFNDVDDLELSPVHHTKSTKHKKQKITINDYNDEEDDEDDDNQEIEEEDDEDDEDNDNENNNEEEIDIDDDDDDDDIEENDINSDDEMEDQSNQIKKGGETIKKKTPIHSSKDTQQNLIEDDNSENNENSDEDDDDDDEDNYNNYLTKFNTEIKENYIQDYHPQCYQHNYDEINILSKIVKNNNNDIIDPLHKTLPFLTKYEKTKIIGQRAKQIASGSKPFIDIKDNIIEPYIIAQLELVQKKIPFIIRRPLPNGASEYWNVKDLEIINY